MSDRKSRRRRTPVGVEETPPTALPEGTAEAEPEAAREAAERSEPPQAPSAQAVPTAEPDLVAEVADLRQRLEETQSNYLYAVAELQNARRRYQRELAERQQYANEQLMRALLPILDDLERGRAAATARRPHAAGQAGAGEPVGDVAAIERGVSMTLMRLHDVLAQFGLAPSVPTVGDQFDPYQHEVAERVEDSEHDEGTILEVVVPGYALHGRVLRPARVKVAARALAEGS